MSRHAFLDTLRLYDRHAMGWPSTANPTGMGNFEGQTVVCDPVLEGGDLLHRRPTEPDQPQPPLYFQETRVSAPVLLSPFRRKQLATLLE